MDTLFWLATTTRVKLFTNESKIVETPSHRSFFLYFSRNDSTWNRQCLYPKRHIDSSLCLWIPYVPYLLELWLTAILDPVCIVLQSWTVERRIAGHLLAGMVYFQLICRRAPLAPYLSILLLPATWYSTGILAYMHTGFWHTNRRHALVCIIVMTYKQVSK